MKIKNILILTLILGLFVINFQILQSETKKAKITLNIQDTIPSNNTPLLFGQFIEYLNHIMNGPSGFWAQDLYNRGFDQPEYIDLKPTGTSFGWKVRRQKDEPFTYIYQAAGGYNRNGREYQVIVNTEDTLTSSVYQTTYVDDEVGTEFYIYMKGNGFNENSQIIISLTDSATNKVIGQKIYYPTEITQNWQKFSISFPANSDILINPLASHRANLNLILKGKGHLELDEASLMQADNIDGIRKGMYEMFVKLKPGLLRYPGGEFADTRWFRWQNTTEHIDQRMSPNHNQRVDFGLHQFMKFCRDINTLPYLVANQENDNLQSNVNFIEYCNGDTNTTYGKLRAKNGDIEPFNVKYWCVGNEQWMPEYIDFAYDYVERVKKMKEVDPNFRSVMWGNYWDFYRYFDSVMKVVGFHTQSYSYHITALCLKLEDVTDTILEYNYTVGGAEIARHSTTDVSKWLKQDGYWPKVTHCIPEWWPNYEFKYEWLDTAREANRIESAIVSAQFLNHYFKGSETLELAVRTTGLSFLRAGLNQRGKKIVYGTPDLHSFIMYRNHFGNKTLNTIVDCEKYNLPMKIGYADVIDNNRVEAVATKSNDTLYLHIINKYAGEDLEIELDFDLDSLGQDIKLYTVNSEYITAENSPDNPELISEKEYDIKLEKFIKLPKLSVSILAIPMNRKTDVKDSLENQSLFSLQKNIIDNSLIINYNSQNNTPTNANFSIYDINGREIISGNLTQLINLVDFSNQPIGMYYIKILSNNEEHNLKFIKE